MSKNLLKDEELLKLKIDIFNRAKIFIEDLGEFAPFGSQLIGEKITPVVMYDDSKEVIEGLKLVNRLENNFSNKLKRNLIKAGAIAYDVFINIKGENNEILKKNALCLLISTDGDNWSKDYYTYQIINQKCIWD